MDLAKELETSADEAKLRSSISRAYYASYCSARNYMEDVCHNKLPSNMPSHQYVIDYYNGKHGGRTNHRRSRIAENLKRMKSQRIMADYYNEGVHPIKALHDTAQFVIELSDDIIIVIGAGGL